MQFVIDGSFTVDAGPFAGAAGLEAWPNPSRGETSLRHSLGRSSAIGLQVYDLAGCCIRNVFAGPAIPGRHQARWDGRDHTGQRVASGVYLVELSSSDGRQQCRVCDPRAVSRRDPAAGIRARPPVVAPRARDRCRRRGAGLLVELLDEPPAAFLGRDDLQLGRWQAQKPCFHSRRVPDPELVPRDQRPHDRCDGCDFVAGQV